MKLYALIEQLRKPTFTPPADLDLLTEAADTIEELESALRDARPYIYNAKCVAQAENQPWRVQTAERILARVDGVLA